MYHDELVQVAQTVWESMLELELQPVEHAERNAADEVTTRVEISGAWSGYLVASCSESLARRLAAVLLQSDAESVLPQHVRDAMAEIANMLGGSIKAIFPGPCKLSLPSVADGRDVSSEPASELLDRVCFDCCGETFGLELRRTAS